MENKEELKHCPFCGKDLAELCSAEEIDGDDSAEEQYIVVCDFTRGGCGATSGYRPSPESAVKAWNMRC